MCGRDRRAPAPSFCFPRCVKPQNVVDRIPYRACAAVSGAHLPGKPGAVRAREAEGARLKSVPPGGGENPGPGPQARAPQAAPQSAAARDRVYNGGTAAPGPPPTAPVSRSVEAPGRRQVCRPACAATVTSCPRPRSLGASAPHQPSPSPAPCVSKAPEPSRSAAAPTAPSAVATAFAATAHRAFRSREGRPRPSAGARLEAIAPPRPAYPAPAAANTSPRQCVPSRRRVQGPLFADTGHGQEQAIRSLQRPRYRA